jgi:hypothetical protein
MSLKHAFPVLATTAMLTAVVAADEVRLKVTVDSKHVAILNGDQPVLRYRYTDVPAKPYIDELRTPGGVNVLRDAPHDHLHHHGLMFATAVDDVNFWVEKQESGRQRHIRLANVGVGCSMSIDHAGFVERIAWVNPAGRKALLHEERRIAIWQPVGFKPTILLWRSQFTLPKGKASAEVSGANYHGLGARFLQSMDPTARFFNADGKTGVDGTNEAKSKWCAMTAQADGKPVTVAMFDHKENKPPITWFTMTDPFAYLAATPALNEQPIEVKTDQPLTFSYLIAVWDGHRKPEDVVKFYQRWKGLKQTAEGK